MDSDKNNVTDSNGGDDEEGWLYGDDSEEKSEQKTCSKTTEPTPEVVHENGVDTQEAGQDDQDSDSEDDDICVTIGDIKTGDSSQCNFGSTPVNLSIKAEGRNHAIVVTKAKGVDLDALGSIQGIPVLDVDVDSFEEKPWRKPGADISDYFNYSFNEETWKVYCEKQRRLRASYESMTLSASKIMVQKGRTGHGDKESRFDYPSSGSLYKSAPRKSSGTIDVIGGQTGSISRVEGRRRHSNEGNNIQASLPLQAPLFPPSSHPWTGIYPLLPPSMAPWAGVMDSAKAWQYYTRQERERDKGRDRSRERGHDKDRERGRDKEREQSPSSQVHHSEEERMRHRDNTERGYDRHRDRSSREKEERHREWRHRDKDEGRHKSSRSSRRRRHDSEEGDSHRRHKHKKSKRNKEEVETSHELSADQENQSEPNE
ncbi:pre-mRNA 3'-end-processing factor FIP1 [Polymixia lowei]